MNLENLLWLKFVKDIQIKCINTLENDFKEL